MLDEIMEINLMEEIPAFYAACHPEVRAIVLHSIPEKIGRFSFWGLRLQTFVYLPEGEPFHWKNASGIYIPEGVIEVGESAFDGGYEQPIELPSSLQRIGRNAFRPGRMCSVPYIREKMIVRIPEGVQEIGENAFPYLTDVTVKRDTVAHKWAMENIHPACVHVED